MPPRRGIVKRESPYMTRDAVRRLRLAKAAARACIAGGGTAADAAAAAQSFGAPCGNSDVSDSGEEGAHEEDGDVASAAGSVANSAASSDAPLGQPPGAIQEPAVALAGAVRSLALESAPVSTRAREPGVS